MFRSIISNVFLLVVFLFLSSCETKAPIGPAAGLPFLGKWDCQVSTFTFTAGTYSPGLGSAELRLTRVEKYGDDTFGLTFADGYRLGLIDVTATTMIWSSPQSGDSFNCQRIA